MAAVGRKNPHAPSRAAILGYMEKKKREEEAAKEKRFTETLNPYKKYTKKSEPDEDFLKAQRKKERMMKKREEAEKKLRDKLDKERMQKANEELARLAKEQEEHRALEEKKRQQEKQRKHAIFGRPVDKKMQEYLERIKAAREAEKTKLSGPEARRAEARKREEDKIRTSNKVNTKNSEREERERERRILENMRRQQNKSITNGAQKDGKSSKVSNGNHVPSKSSSTKPASVSSRPPVSSTATSKSSSSSSSSNRIPKLSKSRVSEYSPTRPSIIEKSHDERKSKSSAVEYSPTKVTKTKEGSRGDMYKSTASSSNQYVPSPKPPSMKQSTSSNSHKVKSRNVGAGDQIARTSSSFESELYPPSKAPKRSSDNLSAKQSRGSSSGKSGPEASRERLLRERELEAERELERQRAKNRELEEQLAKLRKEREMEQERKQVAVKPKTKLHPPSMPKPQPRRPIASNKILPPIGLTYRRGMNYQPTYDDDDEDDEDEEMRDFIDDGDDLEAQKNDVSQYIREIFGYDKRKYAMIDEDDIEEASFAQQMKEEMESAKAGLLEDLEDIRKEEEEKRRKAKLKKRRQVIDDSDED